MVPPDCHLTPETLFLHVLLVGFQETELPSSCRKLLTSQNRIIHLDSVPNIQMGLDQIASGTKSDLILVDRREREKDMWLEESAGMVWGDSIMIVLTNEPDISVVPLGKKDNAVGWLVNESLVGGVLPWGIQQGLERRRFVAERNQLQKQLEELSYQIEMAEVASTVLHNVGNVLNSVNVAANVVEQLVGQSSAILVNRMAELLKGHEEDMTSFLTQDPKGKRIPSALVKVGCHLFDEQQAVLKEVKGLVRNIDHVKHIISSHQIMTKSRGRIESLSVIDLLDQAVELSFHQDDAKWVTIHRQYQDIPWVMVDKHQVLQILVNLLRNAKQAMQQHVDISHQLILRVVREKEDPLCVVLTIQDTGIGIAPEHLLRMFTRGFTTKKEGNGIGLHSALSTIQNMGGSLHVDSEGLGKGAIFTLKLPISEVMAES